MPDDFMPSDPFMVVFPSGTSGDTSACVDVDIFDDDVLECDHDFTVEIDSASLPMVMVGMPSSVTATIQDDCKYIAK